MDNHVHLVIECASKRLLGNAMHLFAIRAARIINTCFARSGRVFAERYHARPLRTPRDVRNALAYVLNNARHHALETGAWVGKSWFDPFSSAPWFDGWSTELSRDAFRERQILDAADPCAPARSWLLAVGWKRHGSLAIDVVPGPKRALGVPRVIWNDDLPAHPYEESKAPDRS
jgi:hypothetical protein